MDTGLLLDFCLPEARDLSESLVAWISEAMPGSSAPRAGAWHDSSGQVQVHCIEGRDEFSPGFYFNFNVARAARKS